ncbi:MAG: hypothetical protein IT379_15020 [Deltaproteobacteria bacterium]|nr:hypothetical protein [Deltaproteobacteria bacterium]
MMLKDSCTFVTRPWRPSWPGSGGSGGLSYETMLVHEIGHAGFGLPDVVTNGGVMNSVYGQHAATMHLYPIDSNTAVAQSGYTGHRIGTSQSLNNGGTWSSVSTYTLLDSLQPGLDSRVDGSAWPVDMVFNDVSWWEAEVRRGNHGAWTTLTAPSSAGAGNVYSWVNVAHSDFGEMLAVWTYGCLNTTHCRISWAWTDSDGASWSTGNLAASYTTFGRPEVAYDRFRDRFVLAWIDGFDARIRTTSSPAPLISWATAITASPLPEVFRYLGGLVFDSAGTGLLVAARNRTGVSPITSLVQMSLTRPSSDYVAGPAFIMNSTGSNWTLYHAHRHFGLARRRDTGLILAAWPQRASPGGGGTMMVATKSSISPSVSFAVPTGAILSVYSGTDVAFAPSTSSFVAGLAWGP